MCMYVCMSEPMTRDGTKRFRKLIQEKNNDQVYLCMRTLQSEDYLFIQVALKTYPRLSPWYSFTMMTILKGHE